MCVCLCVFSFTRLDFCTGWFCDSGLTHKNTSTLPITTTQTHLSQQEQPVFLMDFLAIMGMSILFLWGLEALWTTPPTAPDWARREKRERRDKEVKKASKGELREIREDENTNKVAQIREKKRLRGRCKHGRELSINAKWQWKRILSSISPGLVFISVCGTKTCHIKSLHDPQRAGEHRRSRMGICMHHPLLFSGRSTIAARQWNQHPATIFNHFYCQLYKMACYQSEQLRLHWNYVDSWCFHNCDN